MAQNQGLLQGQGMLQTPGQIFFQTQGSVMQPQQQVPGMIQGSMNMPSQSCLMNQNGSQIQGFQQHQPVTTTNLFTRPSQFSNNGQQFFESSQQKYGFNQQYSGGGIGQQSLNSRPQIAGGQNQAQQNSWSSPTQPKMQQHAFNRLLDNLAFECNKYLMAVEDSAASKVKQQPTLEDICVRASREEQEKLEQESAARFDSTTVSFGKKRSPLEEVLKIQVPAPVRRIAKIRTKEIPFARPHSLEQTKILQATIRVKQSSSREPVILSKSNMEILQLSPPSKIKVALPTSVKSSLVTPNIVTPPKTQRVLTEATPATPEVEKGSSLLSTAAHSNPPERMDPVPELLKTPSLMKNRVEKKRGFLSAEIGRDILRRTKHDTPVSLKSPNLDSEVNLETNQQAAVMIANSTVTEARKIDKKNNKLEVTIKVVLRDPKNSELTDEDYALKTKSADNVFTITIDISNAEKLEHCSIRTFSEILVKLASEEFESQLQKLRRSKVYVEVLGKDSHLGRVNQVLAKAQKILESRAFADEDDGCNDFTKDYAEAMGAKVIHFLRANMVLPIENDVACTVSDWFDLSSTLNKLTCSIVEQPEVTEVSVHKQEFTHQKSMRSILKSKDRLQFGLDQPESIQEISTSTKDGLQVITNPDLACLLQRQGLLAKVKGLSFSNKHGKVTFLHEIRLSKVSSFDSIVEIRAGEISFDQTFVDELIESNSNEGRSLMAEFVHYNIPQKMWYKVASLIEKQWGAICVFSVKDNNSVTFKVDVAKYENACN